MPIPAELPDIRLYFSGLIDFCIRDGAEDGQVGILAEVPGHLLTFDIKEIVNSVKRPLKLPALGGESFDPSEIAETMSLSVEGVKPGIKSFTRPGPFNRNASNDDPNDFRWVIDLEGAEGFNQRLNVNRKAYRTVLTINSGLFFTANISQDKVKFVRQAQTKRLGKVAMLVGANIDLGAPGAKAVLKNGAETIFEFKRTQGTSYEITIGLNRPEPHSATHKHDDFLFHYRAVGFDLDDAEILELKIDAPVDRHHDSFRSSPDVRCTSLQLSRTSSLA